MYQAVAGGGGGARGGGPPCNSQSRGREAEGAQIMTQITPVCDDGQR